MEEKTYKYYNIIKTIIYLAGFIAILTSLSYILRDSGDERKASFSGFYHEKENTLDMVFIGSSPVYPYYAMPLLWNEYGITGNSLSTSVQRPSAMLGLIKEGLKTQKPKVLILEMRMFTKKDDELNEGEEFAYYNRSLTDNLKYSLNRYGIINDTISEVSTADYFDIIRYHTNWKSKFATDLKYWKNDTFDPYKGFLFKSEIKEVQKNDLKYITSEKPISKEQESRLYKILDYCKDLDIKVVFLVSPYEITPSEKENYNYIKTIVESYGQDYINLNDSYKELKLDFSKDFYNSGHVNILGAEKVTRYLGQYMVGHYDLEDKRGRREYDSWDIAYDLWHKRAEDTKKSMKEVK